MVEFKTIEIMGIIEDKKKFKTTTDQKNPTNPDGVNRDQIKQFDIDKATIKKQESKK